MRIELDPDLPEDLADALNAEGRLLSRFAPALDEVPHDTAAIRVSSAAFDRLLRELETVSL